MGGRVCNQILTRVPADRTAQAAVAEAPAYSSHNGRETGLPRVDKAHQNHPRPHVCTFHQLPPPSLRPSIPPSFPPRLHSQLFIKASSTSHLAPYQRHTVYGGGGARLTALHVSRVTCPNLATNEYSARFCSLFSYKRRGQRRAFYL